MSVTDPDIVARAKAGEEEAFHMLVDCHSRRVYRLAYRVTRDPHDAEEAVQETFLRVFRKIGDFEERAKFDTWLYRVASNASMDVVRRRQRHHSRQESMELPSGDPLPVEASGPGPETLFSGCEISDRIEAAMERLTPGERAAFTLRHLQGLSIREICEALDLQTNAVKNAIFRAVQKMRQELAPIASEMS